MGPALLKILTAFVFLGLVALLILGIMFELTIGTLGTSTTNIKIAGYRFLITGGRTRFAFPSSFLAFGVTPSPSARTGWSTCVFVGFIMGVATFPFLVLLTFSSVFP